MKAKIESAKPGRTFTGRDGQVQVYEVVAGGVVYDCMNEKCLKLVGSEVEFESKDPSDPKYHKKMILPKEGGYSGGRGGKTYTPSYKDTREGVILTARTMVLSYSKDLAAKYAEMHPTESFDEVVKHAASAYDTLMAKLNLDKLPSPAEQEKPSAPASGETAASGSKTLETLLIDVRSMANVSTMFGPWWTANQEAIKATGAEGSKAILQEKAKKADEQKKAA